MEVFSVLQVDNETDEYNPLKIFSSHNNAVQWIIAEESPHIEDPAALDEFVMELIDSGSVYGTARCSYQIQSHIIDQW